VLMARGTRDEGYYWASVHKERKMGDLVRSMRDGAELNAQKGISEFDELEGGERPPGTDEAPVRKEEAAASVVDATAPKKIEHAFCGQKSILEYGASLGDGITVYVDARERNPKIIEWLKGKATVRMQNLPVGDYLVSDRIVVERKTVKDFLQSLIDKRLLSQMRELVRNFPHVVLVLEGHEDLFSERNIHPNAIRGALASLILDFGASIIPTKDEEDSAAFIFALAKREQEDEGRLVALRGERKPLTLSERQIFVVESLPNVSAVLARRLLEHFGSVQAIVNASEEELMKVEGIGKGKASEIRNVGKSGFRRL